MVSVRQIAITLFVSGLHLALTLGPALAAELVMFDSPACEYCEQWDREIAEIYPKTDEGQRAPLRRHSIFDPLPDDLKNIKAVIYTPTFVLMDKGQEVGRISGYPGEDFFWGFLESLVAKLPNPSGTCLLQADSNSQKMLKTERKQTC